MKPNEIKELQDMIRSSDRSMGQARPLPTSPEEWASRIENYWILKDCIRRDGKSPFDLLVEDIYRIQEQARATGNVDQIRGEG